MTRRFAAELQSRVIEPWHRKCWAWVRRLKDAPSEKALTGAIRASCMPNQVALRDVLRKYILAAADCGGQDALDKIRPAVLKALKASGIDTRAQEAIAVPALPPSAESPLWKAIEAEWFAAGGPGEVRKGAIPLHEDMRSTVQELLSRGEGWNAQDGFTFHLRDPELQRELLRRGEKIRGQVTDTMLSDFRDMMAQQFYREGLPPSQLELEIEKLFPTTYKDRALVIANTEVGIAYGVANHEASVRNGVDGHEWRTGGQNPRAAHIAASGQVRPITQPFVVGGEKLMHPSDPAGSAGNIINCHCLELPVLNDAKYVPAKPWTGQSARELAREIIKQFRLVPHFDTPQQLGQHLSARYPSISFDLRGMDPSLLDEAGAEIMRMIDAYADKMLLSSIRVGSKLSIGPNVYADINQAGSMILVKRWWSDADKFLAVLEEAREAKYFSPGGGTPAGCITHEMGHAINFRLAAHRDTIDALRGWEAYAEGAWDPDVMGKYGSLGLPWESFAEAWTTMSTLPSSRWPEIVVRLHRRLKELGIV